MDRLLYVAMTGAKQLMQAQTLVAHNLANISTTGFRADLARFEAAPVEGPGYPSRVNTVASGLGFDSSQGPHHPDRLAARRRGGGRRLDRGAGEGRHGGVHARRRA